MEAKMTVRLEDLLQHMEHQIAIRAYDDHAFFLECDTCQCVLRELNQDDVDLQKHHTPFSIDCRLVVDSNYNTHSFWAVDIGHNRTISSLGSISVRIKKVTALQTKLDFDGDAAGAEGMSFAKDITMFNPEELPL